MFNTVGTIGNNLKLETDSNNYLTSSLKHCENHHGCFFQNGQLVDFVENANDTESYGAHEIVRFISSPEHHDNLPSNREPKVCDFNLFSISHYCSTHWNPPIYLHRNPIKKGEETACLHNIELHSPLICHSNSTNYERPCYIYDPQGRLIDLTPWIKSDASSYKVNTRQLYATNVNNTSQSKSQPLKGFYINVCNEAHDMCGPNMSACFMDPQDGGLFEAGYNNLTSIKFDAKENNTILLTSQGHYKEQCQNSRVKTVIRFVCRKQNQQQQQLQNKTNFISEPKLIRSNGCENVIEWETVHACPMVETKAHVLQDCKFDYEPLGISIDVKQITGNKAWFEIPNIDKSGKKMILSVCNSLPKKMSCGGRVNSQTTACLVDDTTKSFNMELFKGSSNNSRIVGSMLKSTLKLADDILFYESNAVNQTCSTPVVGRLGSSITRQIGVRIEFVCAAEAQQSPTFAGFDDCTYLFVWGSPLVCFEALDSKAQRPDNDKQPKPIDNSHISMPSAVETLSPKPAINHADTGTTSTKTPLEQHKETLSEATSVNESVKVHPDGEQTKTQVRPVAAESEATRSQKSAVDKTEVTNPALHKVEQQQPQQQPKMNIVHKYFMICLIVMSLVAFLVVILVLDKKTRLRVPLSSIRRARQAFQPQPVPYSRVINDLDL